MEKVLSVLLALCLIIGAVPMFASAGGNEAGLRDMGELEGGLTWTLMTDGALSVGPADPKSPGPFTIPYFASGAPWSKYKLDIRTVFIRKGVEGVGGNAFNGCKNLEQLYIPLGLAGCGPNAFSGCTGLKTIHFAGSDSDENFREFCAKLSFGSSVPTDRIEYHYNCDNTDYVSPPPAPSSPFSDVKIDDYFADGAIWAYQFGIAYGTGGEKFSPNKTCTRDQIVTFLYRAKGSPAVTVTNQFSDMPKSDEFKRAISWAVENNITVGDGKGHFLPGKGCTRAEAMTFIWRAAGNPEPVSIASFADMPSNSDFQKAISWAYENGITSGIGDGTRFGPNNTCTRGQIVTFLYNWMEK